MLAHRLLAGIGVRESNHELATAIAEATDGISFYIQNLVAGIERRQADEEVMSVELVQNERERALRSGDDPWRLRHYRDRLQEHFGTQVPLAEAVLDAVSVPDTGLPIDDLSSSLAVRPEFAEEHGVGAREVMLVLERLRLDHYLVVTADRRITFTYPIIRDAWRELRLR